MTLWAQKFSGKVQWLGGRQAGLLALLALTLFTASGVFWSMDLNQMLFTSRAFGGVVAFTTVSLGIYLWRAAHESRGWAGWGSFALHFSVVVIIAGAAINGWWGSRGGLRSVEGQPVPVMDSPYQVRVDRVYPVYHVGDYAKGHAAGITWLKDGKAVQSQVVYVNQPASLKGWELHLVEHGFAPWLKVRKGVRGENARAFIPLETRVGPTVKYWGRRYIPGWDLLLSGTLETGGKGASLAAPSMNLVVEHPGREVLFKGTVSRGGSVRAADYVVDMGEVRRWAQFNVKHEPGMGLVLAGFWLGIAGAVAALLTRSYHAGL